jgi:peptidoglycan/xylan/chitin deacetylase (PgdA/CDA1 family)
MEYCQKYDTIKQLQPKTIRGILRNTALNIFTSLDKLNNSSLKLDKNRVQFLYIHHVFKDEQEKLRQLIEVLQKNHTFISYGEGINKILNNEIDKPYIVFSSDDGFKNNLDAAKIFNEYAIKSCFFINPALIGETDYNVISKHCRERLHFPPVEFLNWDEVAQLQKQGHEIGSHTMQHINIANTPENEIAEDMQNTFHILSKNCGDVKHFAFPYGRYFHFSEFAKNACFQAGFTSCATAERGCHINNVIIKPEQLYLRRDHVILGWQLEHIMYFLKKNSRSACFENNAFKV